MLESSQCTPRFVILEYCCLRMRFSEQNELYGGPTRVGDKQNRLFSRWLPKRSLSVRIPSISFSGLCEPAAETPSVRWFATRKEETKGPYAASTFLMADISRS